MGSTRFVMLGFLSSLGLNHTQLESSLTLTLTALALIPRPAV